MANEVGLVAVYAIRSLSDLRGSCMSEEMDIVDAKRDLTPQTITSGPVVFDILFGRDCFSNQTETASRYQN